MNEAEIENQPIVTTAQTEAAESTDIEQNKTAEVEPK